MYVSPQDYLDPMSMGNNGLGSGLVGDLSGELDGSDSLLGSTQGDDVARFQPPNFSSMLQGTTSSATDTSSMFGPLLDGIGSLLQSLGSLFGGSASTTQPSAPSVQPQQQQFFGNATASSTGDPHLAFNGTNSSGSTSNAHWDNMSSHQNLLDSNSFSGGYRLSTTATTPNSSGVTYNQSASVTTRNGNDIVSLDNQGNATVSHDGQTSSLADGQSMSLGGGETVSRAQNGTLTIDDTNRQGGSIATTLSENGNGVDVNAQASNVDLGGYLAGGPNATNTGAQTAWVPQPNPPQLNNQPSRRYPMDSSMDLSATD